VLDPFTPCAAVTVTPPSPVNVVSVELPPPPIVKL
jgi:hypothetical protein